jgi:hypothetical protein
VRTAVPDGTFPPVGTRVTPAHASQMPRLVASSGSVINTASGAHHYRSVGLEITSTTGSFLYNMVALGSPDGSEAELPRHIVFERSYLHGDPAKGGRRGIALNGRD